MKLAKKPSERAVRAAANRAQNKRAAAAAVVLARTFHSMGRLAGAAAKLSNQLWKDCAPDDTTIQLLLEQFSDGAKSEGIDIPSDLVAGLVEAMQKGKA